MLCVFHRTHDSEGIASKAVISMNRWKPEESVGELGERREMIERTEQNRPNRDSVRRDCLITLASFALFATCELQSKVISASTTEVG